MEKLKKFWSILGIALCFSLAGLGGTKKLGNVNNESSSKAKEAPSSQSVSSGSAPINYGRFSTNCTLVENEFNFENDDLYLFAFKVGQGNFVLLRHHKGIVIVDAGIGLTGGDNREVRDLPSLEKIFQGAKVHYVFLTHPHHDHWNYLEDLMDNFSNSFVKNIKYVLCGEKDSWENYLKGNMKKNEKKGKKKKGNEEGKSKGELFWEFLEPKGPDYLAEGLHSFPIENKTFPIEIKIFCTVCNITHEKYANQLSPFIKIEYKGKSILCTGDCEGINFDLLFQRAISLDPIIYYSNDKKDKIRGKKLMKAFKSCVSGYKENISDDFSDFSDFVEKYFTFYCNGVLARQVKDQETLKNYLESREKVISEQQYQALSDEIKETKYAHNKELHTKLIEIEKDFLKNLYQVENLGDLMQRLINIERARNAIKTSDIVVLPHHGTCTENSQRLLGYFCGRKEHKQLFIVSSDPKGRDGLPKASTIEMAPAEPKIFQHPFLYCRDSLGKQVQLKITKKPILVTEAAENDFQCIKITSKGTIKIWDGKEKKWEPFNQTTKTNKNNSNNS